MYCTVLCCTVLHCTVLHCTVLHCTVLYCTVLYPLSCSDQSSCDCKNRNKTVVRNAEITVIKNQTSRHRLTTCRLKSVGKLVLIVDENVCACVGASVGVVVGMIWCSLIEAVSAWSRVSSLWNPVWSLYSLSHHTVASISMQ